MAPKSSKKVYVHSPVGHYVDCSVGFLKLQYTRIMHQGVVRGRLYTSLAQLRTVCWELLSVNLPYKIMKYSAEIFHLRLVRTS